MADGAKKIIVAVIFVILAIVIIFSFVGSSATTMTDSSDSITDAKNCSYGRDFANVVMTYNSSDGYCYNSTAEQVYTAGDFDLPLNTLFSSSGVIWLIVMAMLLLVILGVVLHIKKNK